MREILKSIGKIVLWPFEHLAEIVIVSLILACVTLLELRTFNIPDEHGDGIWLSNVVLSLMVYLASKRFDENDKVS
jgi:hypothetical protein